MPSRLAAPVAPPNSGAGIGSVGRPARRIILVRPIVPSAATFTGPRTGRRTAATRASRASRSWISWMRGSKPRYVGTIGRDRYWGSCVEPLGPIDGW